MSRIMDEFEERNRQHIARMAADTQLHELSRRWLVQSLEHEYSYHFRWMGLPIIQYPQDIVAIQEIIWSVRPEVVIETGIARGGSLVFYASLLQLIGGTGAVIGVEVDLRPDNRRAIDAHPLRSRIQIIDGSSVSAEVAGRVREAVGQRRPVLVILDSNHTHDHVLRELELYSGLVTRGSYLIVLDTIVELLPEASRADRPWSRGNSPLSAVQEFLRSSDRFEVDHDLDAKLQLSMAPSGYLRCVRD